MFKLVHYEAWTAIKRADGIRLKCLLVHELLSIDLIKESSRGHLIGPKEVKLSDINLVNQHSNHSPTGVMVLLLGHL